LTLTITMQEIKGTKYKKEFTIENGLSTFGYNSRAEFRDDNQMIRYLHTSSLSKSDDIIFNIGFDLNDDQISVTKFTFGKLENKEEPIVDPIIVICQWEDIRCLYCFDGLTLNLRTQEAIINSTNPFERRTKTTWVDKPNSLAFAMMDNEWDVVDDQIQSLINISRMNFINIKRSLTHTVDKIFNDDSQVKGIVIDNNKSNNVRFTCLTGDQLMFLKPFCVSLKNKHEVSDVYIKDVAEVIIDGMFEVLITLLESVN
jgi:hypothetical protein